MDIRKNVAIVISAFVAVVVLGWAAFNIFSDDSSGGVSLIQADSRPYKSHPENAEGMDIPHQDKMVFGVNNGTKVTQIEQIMPGPEQPMTDAPTAMVGGSPQALLAAEPTPPEQPASASAELAKNAADMALGRVVVPTPSVPVQPAQVAASAKPVETAAAFDVSKTAGQAVKKVAQSAGGSVPGDVSMQIDETPVEPIDVPEVAAPVQEKDAAPAPEGEPEASNQAPNMAMEPIAKQVKQASQSRFQLASFMDRASAERGVASFSKKYASALNGVKLMIVEATVKGKGRVYRVQGPSASPSSVCDNVKSLGGTCVVAY
jgi:hypothetical protein